MDSLRNITRNFIFFHEDEKADSVSWQFHVVHKAGVEGFLGRVLLGIGQRRSIDDILKQNWFGSSSLRIKLM